MQDKFLRQSKGRFFLYIVISSLIFLSVYYAINRHNERRIKRSSLPKEKVNHVEAVVDAKYDVTSSLLLDSILSIIQSYYVDVQRVENRDLMQLVLRHLGRYQDLQVNILGKIARISYQGHVMDIQLSDEYYYKNLLDDSLRVTGFINKYLLKSTAKKADSTWYNEGCFVFLNSMLNALDPHSSLLDSSAYNELRQGTEGSFGGLGVVVGIRNDMLTVIKPLKNSPASRVGILSYDRIMEINDVYTYGTTLDSLIEHMRGAPGTKVKLSLLREGSLFPIELEMKREIIQVDSVESKLLEKGGVNILKIAIETFSSRTSQEVKNAILKAESKLGNKPLGGIIMDLRSNPGGLLDQAIQVVDQFLEKGRIVSTIGRREEVEEATSEKVEFRYPIALLINGDSASASEIVAGALQDNNRAIIIGQPSFGKGSVQTIFELPGAQALKLTIARYYTPQGKSIQDIGIMPDVWLQPLAQLDKNVNLFGGNRYRNGLFIDENYREFSRTKYNIAHSYKHHYSYKGNYLVEELTDRLETYYENDKELQFALDLLINVNNHYKSVLPKGSFRASHWLAVSSQMISEYLSKEERLVNTFLKAELEVDWSHGADQNISNYDIQLTTSYEDPIEVGEGEVLHLPWIIENKGDSDLSRLSVFAQLRLQGNETVEILTGNIAKGNSKKGMIDIPIYYESKKSLVDLYIGLARDSIPLKEPVLKLKLKVLPRERAKLVGAVSLRSESVHSNGVLEPFESGKLEVSIQNKGKADAEHLNVKLINLSGKQIELSETEKVIEGIKPGEKRKVFFDIRATSTLFNRKLFLGINVDSEKTIYPFRQYSSITAAPNSKKTKVGKLIAH